MTGDIDLDRADPSHIDRKIEVAIGCGYGLTNMVIQSGELQPSHAHRTYLRQIDIARPIHAHIAAEVDLPPDANAQFVIRPDDVIGGDRRKINGRKGGRNIAKKILPIDRQKLARGGSDKFLKLGRLVRRQFHPLLLRSVPRLSADRDIVRSGCSESLSGVQKSAIQVIRLLTPLLQILLCILGASRVRRRGRIGAIHHGILLSLPGITPGQALRK